MKPKHIAILGSTGSIGTQAIEVVKNYPDEFIVEVLTAYSNDALLIKQAIECKPNAVVIGDESKYEHVKNALWSENIKVFCGEESISQIVTMQSIDIVLASMVGYSGLKPVISAIKARKDIALANKETLVVAGDLITKLAKEYGVSILPVDSEHSAIFQCLTGESFNNIEKIILTASGGPFRGRTAEELKHVVASDALKHPNWNMGAKITVDSATLMNKGLEVIEAKWLFNLQPTQIEVVVHPQSIIHSLVQFEDGSIKAQMGLPDMKLPILYALSYPFRHKTDFERFNFLKYPQLTFETPNTEVFTCLSLAYEAMKLGGNIPCVLNAANEIAVQAFLEAKIPFLEIPKIIQKTIEKAPFVKNPDLNTYIQSNEEARAIAKGFI